MKFSSSIALAAVNSLAFAAPFAPVPGFPQMSHEKAVESGIGGAGSTVTGTGTATVAASTGSSSSSNSKAASTTDGPIGYASTNGGTTGGEGGTTTTVSTLAQFTEAATADDATVVYISGAISGSEKVRVTSDTSIIGLNSEASLEGIGLYINKVENVILRNFKSSKVLADNGDAVGIQASSNVWVDHLDLSSDLDHGKDYYDGLLDVTHASEWVTISNTYFHDHYKCKF